MRYSILDLLAIPVLTVFTVPVGTVASAYATNWFPWFVDNCLVVRDWFVHRGLSPETAAEYVPVFVMDIPAFFVIATLSIIMFVIGTRLADAYAVLLLLLYPFVDLSLFYADDARHLFAILKLKSATIATAILLAGAYIAVRRRRPRPNSTRVRFVTTILVLAVLFMTSGVFWLKLSAYNHSMIRNGVPSVEVVIEIPPPTISG